VSTLRVRLFGSLDLEREGQPLGRFPSRKARDLFAYLAIHRRALHAREQLAGIFWGDSDEEKARHALNTTLWRIHRVVGESAEAPRRHGYLRVSAQHIGFNTAGDVWLDVAEFESRCLLAEQAQTPAQQVAFYRQAITFYRADLLVDCYEDWCLIERERLQGLYLRALARLLIHHSAQSEYDQAIDCARRILGCDPLREEVHRDLIRLHISAGQPAVALRQYRLCEDLLRQELAIEPAPETRALLVHILGGANSNGHGIGPAPEDEILVQPNRADLVRVAKQLHELSALCDSTRARLLEAEALLGRLSAELEMSVARAAGRSDLRTTRQR
jgi:DNA-binding SARP family transcriptional activator